MTVIVSKPAIDIGIVTTSKIEVPAKVIREGVTIAIVTDPDGNWVELLENSRMGQVNQND